MRLFVYFAISLLASSQLWANAIAISCGELKGYSYYFEGGYVGKENSPFAPGFREDGYSTGATTLVVDDKNNGTVTWKDSSGKFIDASSKGGNVNVIRADESALNWHISYPDGTIEVYSFSSTSMKVLLYINHIGNKLFPKNGLYEGSCSLL